MPKLTGPQLSLITVQRKVNQTAGRRAGKDPSSPLVDRAQPVSKVLQTKVVGHRQSPNAQLGRHHPVAPPAYRPLPAPKVLQPKKAAPPIYRPQPVPKVLQTKSSGGRALSAGVSERRPVAPPVYRPASTALRQMPAVPQRMTPNAGVQASSRTMQMKATQLARQVAGIRLKTPAPRTVIQRSEDPGKGIAKMERALSSPTFGDVDKYAAQVSRGPAQGLVPSRVGAYYSQVKALEKSNSSAEEIIRKLYIVSRLYLLPELGPDFPELQITDGDGASFNRFNWTMEIPRDWAQGWKKGDSLQELSASILHETRHVEQAWVSVQHFKHKEPRSGVAVWASKAFVSEKVAKILEKLPLPNSLNIHYRVDRPVWQTGPEYESGYSKLRNELDEVRDALSMAKTLGIGKENVPKLNQEHEKLLRKYMNHPRERDAFDVENEYHGFYTAKELGIF